MTTYLLDTSALYPLVLRLKEKLLLYSERFRLLDLTVYEVGNTIWKEYERGRIKALTTMATIFREVMEHVNKLSIENEILGVINVATENSITFYDASYIYIARKYGLKLVTEDEDLKKFSEAVSVSTLIRELGL